MANVDRAAGLIPKRHYMGGLVRANAYEIAGGLASDIFRGDPVKSTGTTKQIDVAIAGDTMLGVFDGCQYIDTSGNVVYSPYWPTGTTVQTGTTVTAWVYDDPNILYEVQSDGVLVASDIGQVFDLVINAGSTLTGQSGVELDHSTLGTGAGVKIIELVDRPDNELGQDAKVHVLIAEHELGPTLAGV